MQRYALFPFPQGYEGIFLKKFQGFSLTGFNTVDYEWKFFICNSEGVFGYTLYIIYTRENFLKNCFCRWYFFWKSPFPVSFSVFQICYMTVFAMRTDLLLLLSWYKRRSNKKKKSRLRLRAYSGKAVLALKNELAPLHCAQTAFFSTARPFLRSRPYA